MCALTEQIIEAEWQMFQRVNENGPRAECQNNRTVFEGMRRGQFAAWSRQALESYAADLRVAAASGRNLAAEKYIRMMERTEPGRYQALAAFLPPLTDRQTALAREINQLLLSQAEELFARFPGVASRGRPLRQDAARPGETSVETYQLGELLTYSEATLTALRDHARALAEEGVSLARLILENSVRSCGWPDLESAEAAVKSGAQGAAGPC